MRPSPRKGQVVGQKHAFTREQIAQICAALTDDSSRTSTRDLALLRVGVDTMLLARDLLALTVGDVTDQRGNVLSDFRTRPGTRRATRHMLLQPARAALRAWLDVIGTEDPTRKVFDLCHRQYSRIIKGFAARIGLNPEWYSTHSVRRTKALVVYGKTKNVEVVRQALGHSEIGDTLRYLQIAPPDPDTDGSAILRSVDI